MGKVLTAIFGGAKTPEPSTAPVKSVEDDKKKAKKSKVNLLSTGGGILGEELSAGNVGGRETLFGN